PTSTSSALFKRPKFSVRAVCLLFSRTRLARSRASSLVTFGDKVLHATRGPSRAGRLLLYRTIGVVVAVLCLAARGGDQTHGATVTLTPGWATFGQALPQGVATGGSRVGTLPPQTDGQTTWPDGPLPLTPPNITPP